MNTNLKIVIALTKIVWIVSVRSRPFSSEHSNSEISNSYKNLNIIITVIIILF